MEGFLVNRKRRRTRRAARVRKRLIGTALKPRLSVMKSNRHLGAQIIDDEKGITLLAVNTQMKEFRSKNLRNNKEAARIVGAKLGERAKENQIITVVFDRGFHKFHGVIAELANAARAAGLQF